MRNEYNNFKMWLGDLIQGITGTHVPIRVTEGESLAVIEICPVEGEFGKIVGKQGATIAAIRKIAFASRHNFFGERAGRLEIEVIDPLGINRKPVDPGGDPLDHFETPDR